MQHNDLSLDLILVFAFIFKSVCVITLLYAINQLKTNDQLQSNDLPSTIFVFFFFKIKCKALCLSSVVIWFLGMANDETGNRCNMFMQPIWPKSRKNGKTCLQFEVFFWAYFISCRIHFWYALQMILDFIFEFNEWKCIIFFQKQKEQNATNWVNKYAHTFAFEFAKIHFMNALHTQNFTRKWSSWWWCSKCLTLNLIRFCTWIISNVEY